MVANTMKLGIVTLSPPTHKDVLHKESVDTLPAGKLLRRIIRPRVRNESM